MAKKAPAAVTAVFGDNWPKRRKWMVRILVWSMFNVQAILVATFAKGIENNLLDNALIAFLALIASIVGTYVFGAVWDDNNKRAHLAENLSPEQLVPDLNAPDQPPEGYAS